MTSGRPSRSTIMAPDEAWQVIGDQRASLASLLEGLSDQEWRHPSLCDEWTVRDVAAHLTLQQLSAREAIGMMLRYRGDTDRAVRESARQCAAAWTTGQITSTIRDLAGSRRHIFGVTYQEALIDVLVHAQDIAIPLGREHPLPVKAAAAAATRVWTMRWPPPFPASRVMRQFRVSATDTKWSAGDGPEVCGPISAILLVSSGRMTALPQLSGIGAAELTARLVPSGAQAQ